MKDLKISKWKIILTLSPYFWGNTLALKIRIILGFVLIIATIALNVGISLILKDVIQALDKYNEKFIASYQLIPCLLLAYGGIYIVGQVVLKARQIVFYPVVEQGMHRFSLKIFSHLHDLDLKFHLQRKIGVIINSIERFQNTLPEIFWNLALFLIPSFIEIFLAVAVLFYLYHWSYAVILLGTSLAFLISSIIGARWATIAQMNYDSCMLEVHGRAVDSLLNYETVRYFNNRQYEKGILDKLLTKLERAALEFRIKTDLTQMAQGVIVGVGLCILTWRSGHEVMSGSLAIADFTIINSYLLQFVAPLVNFGWIIARMDQSFTKLRYVMCLLEEKSAIITPQNAISLNNKFSEVKFENVSFYYQPERPILQDLSFCVFPGKTLAIVGASGAGKSTIARLLFRFYDATAGRILINNQDIRFINEKSLHSTIGIVAQDTLLFNATLYENILYGKPDATLEELNEAIKLAHLDRFISQLPDGLNTMVGERGLKLSGGEKQRISIARVLLKRPSVLLFDEATSSLDTISEQEIKQNIIDISQETTTIIIAHRLSTITHADEIIVLDNGRVIEHGKHEVLITYNNLYAKLWQKQVCHSHFEEATY